MAHRVRNVEMRNRAKLHGNRSKHDRRIAIFRISKWQPSAILDFWKFKIVTVNRVMRVNMRHHAKFCGNRSNHCRECRDMAIFRSFSQNGRLPTSSIFKFSNFQRSTRLRGQRVSQYQFSWRFVEPLMAHDDFLIFENGGRPASWFLSFQLSITVFNV